jgi:hypothetical protein
MPLEYEPPEPEAEAAPTSDEPPREEPKGSWWQRWRK